MPHDPDFGSGGSPAEIFAEIRGRLLQTPFQPFRIVTTSGKGYDVPTADHAGAIPLLKTVQVVKDDLSSTTIHALHISAIEPLPPRRKKRAA